MAQTAPGFWTVWLWKLGMWGLVLLFAFFYLGFVEKHRHDVGADSAAAMEPAAATDSGVGYGESDGGAPPAELMADAPVAGGEATVRAAVAGDGATARAAVVGERPAAVEQAASGDLSAQAVAQQGVSAGDPVQAANEPEPAWVGQAEAHAFAKAVMNGKGVESAQQELRDPADDASGRLSVGASITPASAVKLPEQSKRGGVSGLVAEKLEAQASASRLADPFGPVGTVPETLEPITPLSSPGADVLVGPEATGVVPTGTVDSSAAAGAPPSVALRSEQQPDVSDAAVDAPRFAVRETAAQRHARVMAEYRATQRAVREEMRKRWSNAGGGYPYGAYPQWGYPQRPPSWSYPPAGQ